MDVEWKVADGLVEYCEAVAFMEARAAAIAAGNARELIWLVEHPPLYTAGTSAKLGDLLAPERFPVFQAGRGGQYTYHGPGQRVVYIMLNVAQRGRDVRVFVRNLEAWIIATLAQFGVQGKTHDGRVGVWVDRTKLGGQQREDKIAAIGIRLKKWVSYHGISINVDPNLGHFGGITPCGIADPDKGVTSLVDLGLPVSMDDLDAALKESFAGIFCSRP